MKKRIKSFKYAFKGIFDLFSGRHPNALIHLLAVIVVTGAGLYLGLERWEWVAVLLCFGLVLALEAVNTAIEYVVDLVSPDHHALAGKAKDMAAGAVLIAAMTTVVVAVVIFGWKLLD